MAEPSPHVALDGRLDINTSENTKKNLMASGGVIGAIAMSACCIVPLILFSLGVTGAWIGNLIALYPYKPIIFVVTAAFLAGGFYMVYRKPPLAECEQGSYCATPLSDRVNKFILWSASLLVVVAMAFPYLVPILLD